MNRREAYENLFGAGALFASGLAKMPALVFNPQTEARAVQFLFFCLLVWLSGKKIDPVFTLLAIVFITAFNLIIPYGRVLFSIGAFKITSGALKAGVHRAVTFEALLMLSRVTIRRDLKIHGAFGEILGGSFYIFSLMMGRKHHITGGSFLADIDRLLLELGEEEPVSGPVNRTRTKPAGYVILAAAVVLSWLPWVFIQAGMFYR